VCSGIAARAAATVPAKLRLITNPFASVVNFAIVLSPFLVIATGSLELWFRLCFPAESSFRPRLPLSLKGYTEVPLSGKND